MTNILKNIVTLGAQGRIDRAMERFNSVFQERDQKHRIFISQHQELTRKAQQLKKLGDRSLKKLRNITTITSSISIKSQPVIKVDTTNPIANQIKALTIPEDIGTFTQSEFLSGLSGSAITATTTAGSALLLAGDAAAISAGFVVSVIAIPALISFGAFSHISASKKIAEIQEAERDVLKDIAKINAATLDCEASIKRCDEIDYVIKKSMSAYDKLYKKAYRAVYPIPFFSKLLRRSRVTPSEKSMEDIYNLVVAAKTIVSMIDKVK